MVAGFIYDLRLPMHYNTSMVLKWCRFVLQMLVPIGGIGAVGILLGGLLSCQYALTKAAQTIAALPRIRRHNAIDDAIVMVVGGAVHRDDYAANAVCNCRAILDGKATCTSAAARDWRTVSKKTNRLSVQPTQATQHVIHEATDQQRPADMAEKTVTESSFIRRGRPSLYFRFVFTLRHLLMNIRRASLKSILIGGVALCFTLALGAMIWAMNYNQAEIKRLFNITQVKAEIVKRIASQAVTSTGGGMIRSNTVDTIMDTGFVKEAYLEAAGRSPTVGITIRGTAPSLLPERAAYRLRSGCAGRLEDDKRGWPARHRSSGAIFCRARQRCLG